MLARCLSASLQGLEARPVTVEVDLAPGLPGMQLVGLPDKAIQESRERVRSALRNSGFRGPLVRVIINLAPADQRKEGPAFDLPIALALLVASGQLDAPLLEGLWCAGELSLDGSLRPCRGVIAIADLAVRSGARALVVPPENAPEAALIGCLNIRTASNLRELVEQLQQRRPSLRLCRSSPPDPAVREIKPLAMGDKLALEALAVAAAGGHHLLLVGPPGSGKTHLAQQLPDLLPPLSHDTALAITRIQSIAGVLPSSSGLVRRPPFRAPHHRSSATALLGGGIRPGPGEISLAHGGVLFLDELAEFPRSVLDQLRQPLEEGVVRLSRAQLKTEFPSAITLIAATNPCPCGWHGDQVHGCRCSISQRRRYWQRLSGPLLDRIDLQLRVDRPSAKRIRHCLRGSESDSGGSDPADSEPGICQSSRIAEARRRMERRNPDGRSNRQLTANELGHVGGFCQDSLRLWEKLVDHRSLSTRSGLQLLRVARTLSDLNQEERVTPEAIARSSCLRSAAPSVEEAAG